MGRALGDQWPEYTPSERALPRRTHAAQEYCEKTWLTESGRAPALQHRRFAIPSLRFSPIFIRCGLKGHLAAPGDNPRRPHNTRPVLAALLTDGTQVGVLLSSKYQPGHPDTLGNRLFPHSCTNIHGFSPVPPGGISEIYSGSRPRLSRGRRISDQPFSQTSPRQPAQRMNRAYRPLVYSVAFQYS